MFFIILLLYLDITNSKNYDRKRKSYRTEAVTKINDVSGENSKFYLSEDFQDLLNREWGFKRRERDDVKKPGPRVDAKTLKILYINKSVTG